MNPILEIVRAGGIRTVASLAAESVGTVAKIARGSRRSLMSQGIARIRREFPLLTKGSSGYEIARNVWRRAVRAAESVSAGRREPTPRTGDEGGGGPRRPPRPGRAEFGAYVYRVAFVSPRGVVRWRTVTYHGRAGADDDVLRSVANAKLADGPDVSPGQRRGANYISQQSQAQEIVVLSFYADE